MKKLIFIILLLTFSVSFAINSPNKININPVNKTEIKTTDLSKGHLIINHFPENIAVVACYANIYHNGVLVKTITYFAFGLNSMEATMKCHEGVHQMAIDYINSMKE